MDPPLKELRENIQKGSASLVLGAVSGSAVYQGIISNPARFTSDFAAWLSEESEESDPGKPTREEFEALALTDVNAEPDPRYVTLRNATVVFSSIEAHRLPFVRLDLEAVDAWWIRPGWHPDDESKDGA
jgi:hypothetical protein